MGVGLLIASSALLVQVSCWGGAAFLAWYGWLSLRSALQRHTLNDNQQEQSHTLKSMLLGALVVTLLNPHVYLDTVVVLGSLGGQYVGQERWQFALGAVSAVLCPGVGRSLSGLINPGYGLWLIVWSGC